jgi:hypothetical protein
MVLVALFQEKFLNMLRSVTLLSLIDHMNLIPSVKIKLVADKFLANVIQGKKLYFFFVNKT